MLYENASSWTLECKVIMGEFLGFMGSNPQN